MKVKMERVNSELQRQITEVIAQEIKDPRLGNGIVSVTKVHTTPDLKYAKVFLSVYSQDESERKAAFDTVVRSAKFIRNSLKDKVNIRLLPELMFVMDNSAEYGLKIDKILMGINIPPKDENETPQA